MIHTDTIAAIATGMNTAGIGIIRISGDDSFSVVKKIFTLPSGQVPEELESHRVYYGYIHDGDQMIDEVLLIPLRSPRSFTKEDTIEIDCHGGLLVMDRILKLVCRNGARPAEPGEFTKRAFLNGRIDLSEAEAVIDLIRSKNDLAMDNSLRHLVGGLKERLDACKSQIVHEIARIEAALDDPEHYDLDGYSDELRKKTNAWIRDLTELIDSYKEGRIVTEGIRTVILGKPNVGKSSFLNTLLGTERAIVTEIAGTTRDSIEEEIVIGGIVLKVIDTAGVHDTEDPVESIGVERSIRLMEDADLILMVIDSSASLDHSDRKLLSMIRDKKALILLNKSDLSPLVTEEEIRKHTDHEIISVSAKEHQGFDAFRNYITNAFLEGRISYNDEIFISNQRQYDLLTKSVNSLRNVLCSIDQNMPEDCFSIDLNDAYEQLCLLTGERMNDDVINEVFSKFCMGK